jgi:hypothetical protein
LKELENCDLVEPPTDIFGIKSYANFLMDGSDQLGLDAYENVNVNFALELESVQSVAEVKQEDARDATPKGRRGRRPKNSVSDTSASLISTTTSHTMSLRDVKPAIASTSTGFKRSFALIDEDSMSSTAGGKKMKKYMQKSDDPGVKNAIAAKLNREKKKKEVESLRGELLDSKKRVNELETEMARAKQQMAEMKRENDAVRAKYLASTGLRGVAPSIRDFLTSIIPPLQENYGRFNVEYSDIFDEVSAAVPNVSGQDPTIENPSQVFTTHVDMNARRIRVDYDPCAPHFNSVLCSDTDFLINDNNPAAG